MASTAAPDRVQSFALGIPVRLDPDRIETELATMWKAIAPEDGSPVESAPVTRVCLGNVIWFGSSAHLERMNRLLPGVMRRFPARLILLEVKNGDPADTSCEAYVNAQCFLPSPGQPEICCEIIRFQLGGGAVSFAPGLVAALLLPDLRSTLWYYETRPEWEEALTAIKGLVNRIVTEVSRSEDIAGALEQLTHERTPAFTFSWFSTAFIREQIATLFDDSDTRRLLPEIESVTIAHDGRPGAPRSRVSSALLVGWLAARLRWEPRGPATGGRFSFATPDGATVQAKCEATGKADVPNEVDVTIFCRGGEALQLKFATAERRVQRKIEGATFCPLPSTVNTALTQEADMIGTALTARGGNAHFVEAARIAAVLLRSGEGFRT